MVGKIVGLSAPISRFFFLGMGEDNKEGASTLLWHQPFEWGAFPRTIKRGYRFTH